MASDTGGAGEGGATLRAAIPLGLRARPARDAVGPALARLRRGLESKGWDDAFAEYWRDLGSTPRAVLPPPDGRTNWVWLTDLERVGHAIDLGSPFGEVASTLTLDGAKVTYVGAADEHGAVVSRRLELEPTGVTVVTGDTRPSAGADLVAFVASEGWRARLPQWARAVGPSAAAHGLLRDGGWFGALVGNPWGWTRLARWPRPWSAAAGDARALRVLRRGIRDAGYSEVREYWCATSLDVPEVLVPRTLAAVRAYAVITGMAGQRARLLARGMTAPLFPCLLLLARR